MEGSEFDKAFAVVNAMFEQIALAPSHQSGEHGPGSGADSHGDFGHRSSTQAPIPTPTPNTYYITAKDSDFILIDPLDDHDRNAAALSKMVQGSYQQRIDSHEEPPTPTSFLVTAGGEDHDVSATEDSKEQEEPQADPEDPQEEEGDTHGEEEGHPDEEGEPEEDDGQGPEEEPGPDDDDGQEDEDQPARSKERESRDADDEEEEDDEDGAPLEGAPVTEDDLDDFPPETFMPPTVLGVARHYKVGSSFSVFPVHIPNAPEHIELGSGVPTESQEEDDDDGESPPEEGDDEGAPAAEEGEGEGEDEDDGEDQEPHSTTSSHYVILGPAIQIASDHEEDTPVSMSEKGEAYS